MKKLFLKIYYKVRLFLYSFFWGLKNTDSLITNSQKNVDEININVSDDKGGVFNDILEQKVTQEVEELRYSSYKVANESKKYRYVGNGKAIKKNSHLIAKHGKIDDSDNLPIILIQDNKLLCEDVLTILNEVNNKENKKIFQEYICKIKRDYLPRFLLEKYITKIVVKESTDNYVIDLYCSKYPKQFTERQDRSFLSEIKKIKSRTVRNSDILDFTELSFITSNSWGVDDWFQFSFCNFEYYDIIEFDGNYIIRLGCESNIFMKNILEHIHSKSAEDKYKNKEVRENAKIVIDFSQVQDEYVISDEINLDDLSSVTFSIDNK